MTPLSSPISPTQLEACLTVAQQQDNNLGRRVKEGLDIIYSALEKYGEEKISLSFNGGKDCTVLLHLYAAALYNWRRTHSHCSTVTNGSNTETDVSYPAIPALYIFPPSPFPKLESFISYSEKTYNLTLFRQSGESGMKDALRAYKDAFPNVEAILIGIRRTDPHGGRLSTSNPTDPDWPAFMRVHPILDWSYSDVWSFLRTLNVEYCSLYDIGYTSLGSTYNTFPNPALLIQQQDTDNDIDVEADITPLSSSRRYKPAYELEDEKLERAGRGPSVPTVQQESIPISLSKSIAPRLPLIPSSALPTPAPERDNPAESFKSLNKPQYSMTEREGTNE